MSLTCSVDTCLSNHTTEVDGRSIKFYPLPNNEKLIKQWQTICKSICSTNVTNNNLFRLCELHFEKNSLTQNMQLKPNAVPTIFDLPKRRKVPPVSIINVDSPGKKLKSENNYNSYKNENMFTPQSDPIFTSTPLPAKVRLQKPSGLQPQSLGNPFSSGAKSTEEVYHSTYRLLIQIDKIRSKPGPKSKKPLLPSRLKNESKNIYKNLDKCTEAFQESVNESIQKNLTISDQNRFTKSDHPIVIELDQSSPEKSGMNLKKTDQNNLNKSDQDNLKKSVQNHLRNTGQNIINKLSQNNLNKSSQSNPNQSSQSHLNKSNQNSSNDTRIKLVQQNSVQSNSKSVVEQQIENVIKPPTTLSVCKAGCELQKVIFNNGPAFRCGKCNNIYIPQLINETNNRQTQSLCPQTPESLTCDICYCVFKTKFDYRKHTRLHTYMNPSTPFQCHLCNSVFDTKYNTRKHILDTHGIGIERKKQQIFLPKVSANLQCKLCNLTFKDEESLRNHMKSHKENDKSALPVGELRPVKFACAVCSMEFITLAEIDAHTKIHIETNTEDLRCSICSQVFPNDQILRNHLRDHVARAHRCHLCPKAFVNKSNLKMHLLNHV